jgi:hypothetical protein
MRIRKCGNCGCCVHWKMSVWYRHAGSKIFCSPLPAAGGGSGVRGAASGELDLFERRTGTITTASRRDTSRKFGRRTGPPMTNGATHDSSAVPTHRSAQFPRPPWARVFPKQRWARKIMGGPVAPPTCTSAGWESLLVQGQLEKPHLRFRAGFAHRRDDHCAIFGRWQADGSSSPRSDWSGVSL